MNFSKKSSRVGRWGRLRKDPKETGKDMGHMGHEGPRPGAARLARVGMWP